MEFRTDGGGRRNAIWRPNPIDVVEDVEVYRSLWAVRTHEAREPTGVEREEALDSINGCCRILDLRLCIVDLILCFVDVRVGRKGSVVVRSRGLI